MPEIPDLDAIVSYLRTQIIGAAVKDVSIPLEWMLRSASADTKALLRGVALRRTYEAVPAVLNRAKETIAERMGSQTHLKIRDFLRVHGKGGDPCPKCGQRIAQVGTWQRATNFCRNCQPGLMVEREKKSHKGGR